MKKLLILMAVGLTALLGCSEDDPPTGGNGNGDIDVDIYDFASVDTISYTTHIQPIFDQKCALSGCHTGADAQNGLSLDSYDNVVEGSMHMEVVIPFRAGNSHLVEHIEGTITPRMPPDGQLSEEIIDFLKRWIDEGSRNEAGTVPFSNVSRKMYVSNQGNDLVSVIDLDRRKVIRLIETGNIAALEIPHNIWYDSIGDYWYVTMMNSGELWKFDASDDSFIAKTDAGISPAHVVTSPDGKYVLVTNWDLLGTVETVNVIDATTMTFEKTIAVGAWPHGINYTHDGEWLYVTNSYLGTVSVINAVTLEEEERIPLSMVLIPAELQPLQVVFTHDDSLAYVACNMPAFEVGVVKVIDTAQREVIETVTVGKTPFLLKVSPDGSEVWVANRGSSSISIISTADQSVIATIENGTEPHFAQPHGIWFSADGSLAYVTNENIAGDILPHHPSEEGGVPGNVAVIDTDTHEVIKLIEVEIDPTGLAIREQ